jgi:hypothetical protein
MLLLLVLLLPCAWSLAPRTSVLLLLLPFAGDEKLWRTTLMRAWLL